MGADRRTGIRRDLIRGIRAIRGLVLLICFLASFVISAIRPRFPR
jgi:hypothetical protein